MDYSKLSDNKINAEVALHWLGKGNFGLMNGAVETFGGSFNPCKNPADAWPIIQQNLISLKPVSLFVGVKGWLAWRGGDKFCAKAVGNNPLRAAMIVYLMMQESE